ncbi:hypothetical protein NSMS1_03430 [Nostoc sp. MS1]|nr:hypothetical protein NSMS1_03430 [Nostoc sp. MS1]
MNLAEIISKLWNTYRKSTWELTAFIEDTQRSINETSQKHGRIAEKLRKVRQGESVENEKSDEKTISIELSEEELDALVSVITERGEMIGEYPRLLVGMAFIYLVALFDAFLTDAFAAVLIERPEALKSKKQLTYDKILELQQKGELVEFMARREINELSYKSMADQSDYYKAKFNINLADSGVYLAALIEIRARRNLLVHNNGVVNDIYIEAVKQTKYNLGDRVEITFDYWNKCKERLNSVANFVHKSIIEKFVKENS